MTFLMLMSGPVIYCPRQMDLSHVDLLENLLLHECIWWFFQYLGVNICWLWLIVCVSS